MKKRIFGAFLATILIFGMMPVTVFAEEPHSHDGKTFAMWNSTDSLPTEAGSYYLTSDVTFPDSTWEISSNNTIDLCLNGHAIKMTGSNSLINVTSGATLNLYDCGTTVTSFKQSTGDEYNRYWVEDTNGDKTVTGGYILGGTNLNYTNGLIQVNGGIFNMYGGTVVGTKNNWSGWSTAGVWVQTGTFNMYGGAFKGCNARDGVIETSGDASATVSIYDGALIENCTSSNCAGAIFLRGKTDFYMYGGTIKDCVAYAHGGAINAKGADNAGCNVYLYGGKIVNNKTGYNNEDSLGGGGVCIEDSYAHVTVGGNIEITGNGFADSTANNLRLNNGNNISLGTGDNAPQTGMNIGVTLGSTDGTGAFITNGTADDAKYFFSDDSDKSVAFENNTLKIVAGHSHDDKTFNVWYSTDSLPTTSGSYYLTNDVTFTNSRWEIPKDQTIDLCLNGHVITLNGTGGGNNNISINLGATLNLYDCGTAEHKFTVDANGLWTLNESATENYETVTGGVITGGVNGTGGAIYLSWSNDAGASGATLNMYGGNIVGNKATGNGGGAVYIDRPSTFNMSGGKIIGNIATKNGGAVYLHTENKGRNVTFNMSGGEICDNKATEFGGGVYVESNIGTFNMSGGTIAGCSAQKGGGVFTYGSMTMSGDGAIRDCMATIDGGGVCACNCSFSMTGNSVVSNCVAGNGGGGVYTWADAGASASFTMSDASKIENCVAKYTYASNLRSGGGLCVENSTFTMTGGAITNNKSKTDGGGVYFMSGNATLGGTAKITDNVKGDTLSGGTTNNIYLPDNKTVILGTDENSPQTGMSVGVTTQTAPTEGTPVQIATNGASTDTSYFTSDNDAYEVKFNSDHLELAVKAVPHVHNLVKVDGQAATETTPGWKDYYKCQDSTDACDALFEDASGSTPIDDLTAWKAEGGRGYIAKLDAPKYGITVSNDGNGTASASVSEAASGTNVTLTATPSPGYVFDVWEVLSGGITISDNAFTMPASAVEVMAKFKEADPNKYTITLSDDGHGSAVAKVNGVVVSETEENATVTLTATPSDGYVFDKWEVVSGGITISNNSFTMLANDISIMAHFKKKSSPTPDPKPTPDPDPNPTPSSDPTQSDISEKEPEEPLLRSYSVNKSIATTGENGKEAEKEIGGICFMVQQGPLCQAAFKAATPNGFKEAFTFNFSVDTSIYHKTNYDRKKGLFVLNIPKAYQKKGRIFRIIGVNKNGQTKVFTDSDLSDGTFSTSLDVEGYAFSLIYSDSAVKSDRSANQNSSSSQTGSVYTVKSGDTLSTIARRLGVTLRNLIDKNSLDDPDKLSIGQKINY